MGAFDPNDAQRAVYPMEMLLATASEQTEWRPGCPESTSVSAYTGKVIVGNLGSYNRRNEYELSGHNINLIS